MGGRRNLEVGRKARTGGRKEGLGRKEGRAGEEVKEGNKTEGRKEGRKEGEGRKWGDGGGFVWTQQQLDCIGREVSQMCKTGMSFTRVGSVLRDGSLSLHFSGSCRT